jgi:hypothetical protein
VSTKGIVSTSVAGVTVFILVISLVTGHGDEFGPAIGMLVLFAAYWLPTIIAGHRRISLAPAVMIVNLFLGWTFIGWVVALAMAVAGNVHVEAVTTKKCPDCAETILIDAKVCKHCGYRFARATGPKPATKSEAHRKPPAATQPTNRPNRLPPK